MPRALAALRQPQHLQHKNDTYIVNLYFISLLVYHQPCSPTLFLCFCPSFIPIQLPGSLFMALCSHSTALSLPQPCSHLAPRLNKQT